MGDDAIRLAFLASAVRELLEVYSEAAEEGMSAEDKRVSEVGSRRVQQSLHVLAEAFHIVAEEKRAEIEAGVADEIGLPSPAAKKKGPLGFNTKSVQNRSYPKLACAA